jgi:hypothetical protein
MAIQYSLAPLSHQPSWVFLGSNPLWIEYGCSGLCIGRYGVSAVFGKRWLYAIVEVSAAKKERSSRRSNHEAGKKPCRRVSSLNGVRIGPAGLIRTREDISVNSRK